MRSHVAAIALVAVAAAACAPKGAEKVDSTTPPGAVAAPAANTKADEDSIRAIHTRIESAMNARDTTAIAALYADDGVDFTPGTPPAKGHAELAKEYAGMFGSMKTLKMSIAQPDVSISQGGDLAVSHASYDMAWTDAKGKAGKDHGNVVIGWKKVNGAWKVVTSMNASDVPMPGM